MATVSRPNPARPALRRLALPLLLGWALAAPAVEVPIPPPPTNFVTDTTSFLSPQGRAALDEQLAAFSRSTGDQVLVWIGETTGDTPTEEWTVRAFESWKVGQTGLDNGLALFVFAADHAVRVEVGYGLEERVPDVVAARIIREVVVPKIQAGDHDGAVSAGASALLEAIAGGAPASSGVPSVTGQRSGRASPGRPLSTGQIILFSLLAVGFLILLVTHPSLALYLLFSILSGGRGGGSVGGGGGFSGGGGRSGGGGATGSW